VRLSDVASVTDSVQDVRNAGMTNAKPAILLMIRKLPEANIIETVNSIRARLPELQETIPAAIDLQIAQDRSPTIRASLEEVEQTLVISVALVILVVFLFLRSGRATLIPAVAVPVSLIGTFAAMYLCGFSLNNLSLMALTIATGFVVDDAIVVLENISRHLEAGVKPLQAALQGTREVGFTVLSMSLSLVAVFLPLLLMGGLPGRLLREFAVTLSVAIGISLHLADADADDVRLDAQAQQAALAAAPQRLWPRADGDAGRLRQIAEVGAEPYPAGRPGADRHHRAQRLDVYHHPENLLPGAGYRRADGRHSGGPEHFVPGDARQAAGLYEDHS
jgi:hypothetical protein